MTSVGQANVWETSGRAEHAPPLRYCIYIYRHGARESAVGASPAQLGSTGTVRQPPLTRALLRGQTGLHRLGGGLSFPEASEPLSGVCVGGGGG